jgi:hypothetical protein
MHPTLRLHDGYDDTSPALRDEVKALQTLLRERGFDAQADGFFGDGTDSAVKAFQRAHDLDDDGIVGPRTWAALDAQPPPDPMAVDFPTTYPRNEAGLSAQLEEAGKYRDTARAAASKYHLPLCIVAGVASRESGWGLALRPRGPSGTGDFAPRAPRPPMRSGSLPPNDTGFGRGLMQIDFDAHEFARSGNWTDPAANIEYGAGVIEQSRAFLARATTLDGVDLWRAALAAYNCGAGNVVKAIQRKLDVDFFTSGRNYGRDTLNRAGWFRMKGWT